MGWTRDRAPRPAAATPPTSHRAILLLLRQHPLGYVVAFPLVVLLWVMSLAVLSQTAFQLAAGWKFTTAELVGPVAGFLVLGAASTWLGLTMLRGLGTPPRRERTTQPLPAQPTQPVS